MKAYKITAIEKQEEKDAILDWWYDILDESEVELYNNAKSLLKSDTDKVSDFYGEFSRYELDELGEAFEMCSIYHEKLILTGEDEPSTGVDWLCSDMTVLDENGAHYGTVDVEKTIEYYRGINEDEDNCMSFVEDPRNWTFDCWGYSHWTNSGWKLIIR